MRPPDDRRKSRRKWIVCAVVAAVLALPGWVVLGLLATLVIPNVMARFFTDPEAKARADIIVLAGAVEAYALENDGRFPRTLEALVIPDEHGQTFLDRDTVPLDPWGNPYLYEPPLGFAEFRVFTHGEDGRPGGEGAARDIDLAGTRSGEY